jgi:hypothetical protein
MVREGSFAAATDSVAFRDHGLAVRRPILDATLLARAKIAARAFMSLSMCAIWFATRLGVLPAWWRVSMAHLPPFAQNW